MQAFHNNPKIKAKYIQRVKAHQKADELIKGQYWKNSKGCAIGCTIHGNTHKTYESELGIPEELAFLEDGIFEGLLSEDAMRWPLQFLQAITPGHDLRRVHNKFLAWLLSEETGIIVFENSTRPAILTIRDLQKRAGNNDVPTNAEWSAAESAAESAARAAWSAARSAAESAAWSAARAAQSAAQSAAESAARSAAESAARSAAYQKMAVKLLELLQAA